MNLDDALLNVECNRSDVLMLMAVLLVRTDPILQPPAWAPQGRDEATQHNALTARLFTSIVWNRDKAMKRACLDL